MLKVIDYNGFILSPVQEPGGFRIAMAHADGCIFAIGEGLSRFFFTPLFGDKDEALDAAKSIVDTKVRTNCDDSALHRCEPVDSSEPKPV